MLVCYVAALIDADPFRCRYFDAADAYYVCRYRSTLRRRYAMMPFACFHYFDAAAFVIICRCHYDTPQPFR